MSRKLFFVAAVCIALGMGLSAQETFTWQLALEKDSVGLPLDGALAMNNGEVFSIHISTEKDCFAYIVAEQASGAIKTLLNQQIKAGPNTKVGPFKLGNPRGQERFYVITSAAEQRNLHNAIEAYKKEKSEINARILKERLFEIRDPAAQKPAVPKDIADLAGDIRGPVIQATEYSGAASYAKTIIINH